MNFRRRMRRAFTRDRMRDGQYWRHSKKSRRDLLPPSELAVVRLVAEGLRNAEIARERGVMPNTVKSQIKDACRRLDARDRTHLVTLAFRKGLIE